MDIYSLHKRGLKINTIARKLGLNWRTVCKYIENGFEKKPYDSSSRTSKLSPFHNIIENFLSDDNYSASWIFNRLRQMGFKGSYDLVKRHTRKIKDHLSLKAYIRFETEPGKQAQVDFGEFQVVDEFGIVVEKVYLFAMILGYSRMPYYEFIFKRDMINFLDCHIHAFEHFGGIPDEILYDRMKNVLIRQLAGKLEWNKEFYSFCLHYKFNPLVAPPYAPWVKGKVERPMHYVRENFWRGYNFRDLETANRDLHDWMFKTNTRVHGTTHERIDHRFIREKPSLSSLPDKHFDTSLKIYRTVRKDCRVAYLGNQYVLPHSSVNKMVLLKIKDKLMSIYLDDSLLVVYEIPEGKGHVVADKRFYQDLKYDIIQLNRKYKPGRFQKGKAKKTLGITGKSIETVTVAIRSIDEYLKVKEG